MGVTLKNASTIEKFGEKVLGVANQYPKLKK